MILDQPNGFSDPFKGLAGHSWVTPGRSMSADGRYVVFFSQSDGLSASAGDDLENVYRIVARAAGAAGRTAVPEQAGFRILRRG